jgi:hypothetical protein
LNNCLTNSIAFFIKTYHAYQRTVLPTEAELKKLQKSALSQMSFVKKAKSDISLGSAKLGFSDVSSSPKKTTTKRKLDGTPKTPGENRNKNSSYTFFFNG